MNLKNISILSFALVMALICSSLMIAAKDLTETELKVQQEIESTIGAKTEYPNFEVDWEPPTYIKEGYTLDYYGWKKEIQEDRKSLKGKTKKYSEELDGFIEKDDLKRLKTLEKAIAKVDTIKKAKKYQKEYAAIIDKAKEKKEAWEEQQAQLVAYSSGDSRVGNSGGTSNFKSAGVVYRNGKRYTYYSSRVTRHYRTDEWSAGDDGFYRTKDGYLVCASDEYSQGSVIDTPFGKAQVLDCGAGSNTVDMYVNY